MSEKTKDLPIELAGMIDELDTEILKAVASLAGAQQQQAISILVQLQNQKLGAIKGYLRMAGLTGKGEEWYYSYDDHKLHKMQPAEGKRNADNAHMAGA